VKDESYGYPVQGPMSGLGVRRVGLQAECFSGGSRTPSVFSLASIEQGDFDGSSLSITLSPFGPYREGGINCTVAHISS